MMVAAAAAVVMAAGAALQAQDMMPQPAAEMAQIKFFEGNWTCAGKMHETPMSPAGEMTGTVSIKPDLGGFYQTLTMTGNMPNMPPFNGMAHTTWDPIAKQFVMFWFDSMGAWSRATSSGWKGDVIVYEGEGQMGPMPMKGRDTFTKNADGSFKHLFEAEMGGTWVTMGEETCKKS
jgi:hypothetical protein